MRSDRIHFLQVDANRRWRGSTAASRIMGSILVRSVFQPPGDVVLLREDEEKRSPSGVTPNTWLLVKYVV